MTTIALVHYGSDAFVPLLQEWLRVFRLSGCKLPVVVFADEYVSIPLDFKEYTGRKQMFSYIRLDDVLYPGIIRPGKAFDSKGCIILQGIQKVLGRLLIVDTDAFFVKDPTHLIEALPNKVKIMMGEDPNIRTIQGLQIAEQVRERNAGVLYFGEGDEYSRRQIAAAYAYTFRSLREYNNNPMLEQCTWTMLARTANEPMLPRELNWSYLWGRTNERAHILHEHGPQKWRKIPNASCNKEGVLDPLYANAYK